MFIFRMTRVLCSPSPVFHLLLFGLSGYEFNKKTKPLNFGNLKFVPVNAARKIVDFLF